MRKLVAALLVLVATAGAATAYAASTRTVKVGDDWFVKAGKPRTISVKKGARLRFKWVGKSLHNVVKDSGPGQIEQSEVMRKGIFRTPKLKRGTYVFYCQIHGKSVQSVTVKVK